MALECARTEKALLVKKQLRKHFRRSPACGSEVLQGALCLALTLLQHQEFKFAWHANPTLWTHVSKLFLKFCWQAGRELLSLRMLLTPV